MLLLVNCNNFISFVFEHLFAEFIYDPSYRHSQLLHLQISFRGLHFVQLYEHCKTNVIFSQYLDTTILNTYSSRETDAFCKPFFFIHEFVAIKI